MLQFIPVVASAVARAGAPVLAKIAARIGSAANPTAIMATIKANPVMASLVAVELWGAGSDIVSEMASASPEMGEALSAIGYKPDSGDSAADGAVAKFDDEFEILERASDLLGGFDNFLTLRNALKMDDAVVTLYNNLNKTWKRRR